MTDQKKGATIKTGKVRASYCNVFRPTAGQPGEEPKYKMDVIIPKTDQGTYQAIAQGLLAAAENGRAFLGLAAGQAIDLRSIKHPLKDGDTKKGNPPEYAGAWYMTVTSKNKPGIIDLNGKELLSEQEFYSGCYCMAEINFAAYNPAKSKGNRGIGAYLNNILKIEDGMSLAGKKSASEAFKEHLNADAAAGAPAHAAASANLF